MQPYILKPHLTRRITFMKTDDRRVPKALFDAKCIAPELSDFPYPLPSKKSDYTCTAKGNNDILWLGGKSGITRVDKNAHREEDIIMYFCATRHIQSNNVQKILADRDDLWVLTDKGVSHIEMLMISAEEKANILLEETNRYVMRRGMVSQKKMTEAANLDTCFPYAACDNDGTFTAGHAIGEMYHYAVLKREKGAEHPDTIKARKEATLACEACLLLMYIHGREEGFIARSYHLINEPVPDDGIFYKRCGNTAVCVETTVSKQTGRNGEEVPCTHKIPDRLAKLYRDNGFTDDDITYKADTSSDEVTNHYLQMRIAHDILGPDDSELDEIIKDACKRTTTHIINGGFDFLEHSGKPTTWARWSKNYFENEETGYVDAPLNAAEMLMYLKVTMYITGESGLWQETYDKLIAEGYADLTLKHYDRFFQGAMSGGYSVEEDFMYGDHMLALAAFWMLTDLEKNDKLLTTYRNAFKTWKSTLLREHNPGYDFPFALSCPDEKIDIEKDVSWFNRMELSRYAGSVELCRHDVPVRVSRGETDLPEIAALLMPDERTIRKYDHNPFHFFTENWGKDKIVEGCYVYTFAYWIGRYYGFIAEED